MSASERLERRLPDLMDELAPPRIPDYFDDMLRATARTRQRPAWTSFERLLPMEITARPAPFGLPSWRPLVAVLTLVALLVVAGAVLIAGSQRELPPLFGPARNGLVIYSGEAGDILSFDPVTGKTATIVGGATDDRYPGLSPDGQRLLFSRIASGGNVLYTANVDGSNIKEYGLDKDVAFSAWSPDSRRILSIAEGGGTPQIVDLATNARTTLPVTSAVHAAWWLTDARLILADENVGRYWTINADGTGQVELSTPDACCGAGVLPGSGLLAWTSWPPGDTATIHVLDAGNGQDRLLPSTDQRGIHFLDPQFSPDGKWLTVYRFVADVDGVQLALIAADGSGEAKLLGPSQATNGAAIRPTFSPDGSQLLVTYEDGSTWLFAIPSGEGSEVEWAGVVEASWQRLAPKS